MAPNAFKGSLSAEDAVKAIELGVKSVCPDCEVESLLVSDGGDGFVQALRDDECSALVRGPLGDFVQASFLYSSENHTAIIEMASSSGLALLVSRERKIPTANLFYKRY